MSRDPRQGILCHTLDPKGRICIPGGCGFNAGSGIALILWGESACTAHIMPIASFHRGGCGCDSQWAWWDSRPSFQTCWELLRDLGGGGARKLSLGFSAFDTVHLLWTMVSSPVEWRCFLLNWVAVKIKRTCKLLSVCRAWIPVG